jgi:hypothetical protein
MAVIVALPMCAAGHAQQREGIFDLDGSTVKFARLAPEVLLAQKSILVDDADNVDVMIVSSAEEISTNIVGPAGQALNEETIGNYGGVLMVFEGSEAPGTLYMLPCEDPGLHLVYSFPSLGAGTYVVNIEATSVPTEDVAILIEVRTDSSVRAALLATEDVLVQSHTGLLAAVLFEGTGPVTGATVDVWLKPPTGDPVTLALLDNGIDADDAVGDGLYSGLFEASEVGEYVAVAEITGLTSGGTAFTRMAAASVEVVAASATFAADLFTD